MLHSHPVWAMYQSSKHDLFISKNEKTSVFLEDSQKLFALEDAPRAPSAAAARNHREPPPPRTEVRVFPAPSLPVPGSASSAGVASMWVITAEEKAASDKLFVGFLKSSDKLNGTEAREVMLKSGLGNDVLGKIWALCDVDGDKHLDASEFCLVRHFITKVRRGGVLPDSLPADYIPPEKR